MRWAALATGFLLLAPAAGGFHLYRNTDNGCSPRDGPQGDPSTPSVHVVRVLHNTFADATTLLPLTVIDAGESVTWTWNSAHCHSATGGAPGMPDGSFDTGFHYPMAAPPTPQVVPGFLEYPVPALGQVDGPVPIDTGLATLSYTETFDAPGTYAYFCVHHYYVGMVGVVVVQ